jgi:DNA repair exonuclease SbcCD ATPase subunit
LTKLEELTLSCEEIKGQFTKKAKTMDDIVALLEIMKFLKEEKRSVGDVSIKIADLQNNKRFLDEHEIYLESEDFKKYLALLVWPYTFALWLEKKKNKLEKLKTQLRDHLIEEREDVKQFFERFKTILSEFKNSGKNISTDYEVRLISLFSHL